MEFSIKNTGVDCHSLLQRKFPTQGMNCGLLPHILFTVWARKAMPKNAQTTAQFHSSHMLVKWCLKFSNPGFSNKWTVNFQILKLVSEKAEEPEIKLPTSAGSSKKQGSSRRNIYFWFIDYAKGLDSVDHNKLWKIMKEMGIPDYLTCLLRNLYAD